MKFLIKIEVKNKSKRNKKIDLLKNYLLSSLITDFQRIWLEFRFIFLKFLNLIQGDDLQKLL